MRPTRWILAAALLLLVAFHARRVVLVALGEYRSLHPAGGAPERPADVEALSLEDIRFVSGPDTIRGWFLRGTSGAVVVAAHGGGADRLQMLPIARALHRGGFSVLLFDWPGHGASGGRVTYGTGERRTLVAAVDYLAVRPDVDPTRIGVYGFSLGGYIALQVTADEPRIGALAVLAAPTDLREQGRYEYRRAGVAGRWAARTSLRLAGIDLDSHRPVDVVPRIAPRPLLIVQGDADEGVPATMAHQLHERAGEPKALWIIRDGGHRELLGSEPPHAARLLAFFAQALPGRHGTARAATATP